MIFLDKYFLMPIPSKSYLKLDQSMINKVRTDQPEICNLLERAGLNGAFIGLYASYIMGYVSSYKKIQFLCIDRARHNILMKHLTELNFMHHSTTESHLGYVSLYVYSVSDHQDLEIYIIKGVNFRKYEDEESHIMFHILENLGLNVLRKAIFLSSGFYFDLNFISPNDDNNKLEENRILKYGEPDLLQTICYRILEGDKFRLKQSLAYGTLKHYLRP